MMEIVTKRRKQDKKQKTKTDNISDNVYHSNPRYRKEQEKIASILSKIEILIQKQHDNKSNLENLKKGLMQQLFTGKIRVKV